MTPFDADAGTLRLLASLTRAGRCVLEGFLRRCDAQRTTSPSESCRLDGIHFTRPDVHHMKLSRRTGGRDSRIGARTRFTDGTMWTDGRLMLPGVTVPEAVAAAAAGRTLGDLVATPPFPDMPIRRCAQIKGPALSVHCDAPTGEIPYADIPRRPA